MTGPYRPPPHPPTHPSIRRRSPPQVIRAEDAREDNEDEDGEAPPAYADAVAVGPDAVLPPQRRDEQGRLMQPQTPSQSNAGNSRPNISSQPSESYYASASPRPNNIPGSFPPPGQHPNFGHPQPQMAMGYPGRAPMPQSYRPQAQVIPHGHRPPPGALVLRPGDPRIGGRLCYKCGGPGILDSLWWGSETCYVCGGSGRIL